MNAQPCLPQDIIEVNRSKEYTLISTNLLESVLTDTRLNAQTTKLWQILFNYSRFNSKFEIKISYSYLAKKLGKSERTIARYVDLLQNTGYLIVKHNFDKNGGQRPSTLSVRVPENTIEHTKQKKDRQNIKQLNINETSIHIPDPDINHSKQEYETDPVNVSGSSLTLDHSNVLCGTVVKNTSTQSKPTLSEREIEIPNDDKKQISYSSLVVYDKNDVGGHDINDIQINNNKKEINKNNNTVVPFFQNKNQSIQLQNIINSLEQQLREGNKQLSHINNHSELYDQIKKNSRIEAELHLSRIALEKFHKDVEEKTKQDSINYELNTNVSFIHNKIGERILPMFTFKRLINSLKSYGYSGSNLNILINEIVFEARFGSLTTCSKTKKTLSLDNAINIGLKLVREKRWNTPTPLVK